MNIELVIVNGTKAVAVADSLNNKMGLETLLKKADIALYRAKTAGKNAYKFL